MDDVSPTTLSFWLRHQGHSVCIEATLVEVPMPALSVSADCGWFVPTNVARHKQPRWNRDCCPRDPVLTGRITIPP
jgi:hypothetical protein